jgi:phosphopantothenoylcysteine synthetase/decarboxylase
MSAESRPRVLYVITCGGAPAVGLPRFVEQAQDLGWDVCVIATPSGLKFIDAAALAAQTGHPVRSDYKQPDEPDVLPSADAFVIVPATFNTINKLAAGISDTLALGLLNEGLGGGKPIIAAPYANEALARHPAYVANLAALASWGVGLIPDPAGAAFDWTGLIDAVGRLG